MISNIRKLAFLALSSCSTRCAARAWRAPLRLRKRAPRRAPCRSSRGSAAIRWRSRRAKPQAQRYFDQGLKLAWGFHFAAAERSFRRAAELDPQCAMCRWGIAFALGPSINHDPTPSQVEAARAASTEAMALAAAATARERGLIEAQARRHPRGAKRGRRSLCQRDARARAAPSPRRRRAHARRRRAHGAPRPRLLAPATAARRNGRE